MPSGQQIITAALTRLGVNEQGGVPSSSDSDDALDNLNSAWQAWGIDEGLIYAVQTQQFALISGTPSYAIGPTAPAPFNVPVPPRIYKAVFVTATGRYPVKIVDQATYFGHPDLAASAKVPEELYPDFNVGQTTGTANLYLYPVPNVFSSFLEIESSAPFGTWDLTTNYDLPEGYQDALEWALAYRLLSTFGASVAPEVAQNVTQIGAKAEARLRVMNAKNRSMEPAAMTSPELQLMAALPPKQA